MKRTSHVTLADWNDVVRRHAPAARAFAFSIVTLIAIAIALTSGTINADETPTPESNAASSHETPDAAESTAAAESTESKRENTTAIDGDTLASAPVGMAGRIEQIVIGGSELEAAPAVDGDVMTLRVTGVFKHGSDHRYDLTFIGVEPGEYDLRDWLRRKDGSSLDDAPPLRVAIRSSLPPGQFEPSAPKSSRVGWIGGYRIAAAAAGALWTAGLIALWMMGRRRASENESAAHRRPRTLADRLRPMVQHVIAGTATHIERAELERLLIAYWRKQLDLQNERPADAMRRMRDHPEAGAILEQLESWLHHPKSHATEEDIVRWLEPYQHLPDDVVDETAAT